MAVDEIGVKFINDKETLELFTSLTKEVKGKIITQALTNAAKIINKQVKSNFNSIKKGKSKTNYIHLQKALKIKSRRKQKDIIGVKVGFTREGYKYRFIQWGTNNRFYKSKKTNKDHNTGEIEGTNFFYSAVASKKKEAENSISNEITKSLERVIKKYSK